MAFLIEVVHYLRTYWPHVLALLFLIRLIRFKYHKGLNNIPGPFLGQFTGLWGFYHVIRGHAVFEVEMHEKYKSPMVRVAPNTISICKAAAVRTIYGYQPPFEKVRAFSMGA